MSRFPCMLFLLNHVCYNQCDKCPTSKGSLIVCPFFRGLYFGILFPLLLFTILFGCKIAFSNIFPFLIGSISFSLSDITDLVFAVSFCSVHLQNDLHSFCFVFELLRTFECQKRLKDTPSFMFCAQRSDEKTNV